MWYLQIFVVHSAAAVCRLCVLLACVEQSTQFAEEARPWYDELHSCKKANFIKIVWREKKGRWRLVFLKV